ncbi:MAG TPA: Xaa-Pro peptidase family protein [Syntrophobacteraceae bacterium]|nr:Xaa-Pro peptidase family protein [Syntrophobacteraceae bacterium]
MQKVPGSEIANRIVALQELLKNKDIDSSVIRQNADLFYFSGTVQDAHLVVPARGNPVYLVRRSFHRAEAESPLRPVIRMENLADLRKAVFQACEAGEPKTVGFELDVLPANAFFTYKEKIFPKQQIVDISGLVRQVRTIKSPWEIQVLRDAAAISKLVAESVPTILKPRMTEFELLAELEAISRRAGNYGMIPTRAFNMAMTFGHVLSGANAAVPSYANAPTGGPGISPAFGQGAGNKEIAPGEIVSIDTAVAYNGYLNDQTRNFCIGPPPPRLAGAYEFVRSAHWRLRNLARPGAVTGELYDAVWRWAREAGWAPWFMGFSDPRITFVGHGLGIEIDEFPFIAQGQKLELQPGMVFAFEPKVIIPGEGIAGLENDYLVTNEGIESLNTATEELVIV